MPTPDPARCPLPRRLVAAFFMGVTATVWLALLLEVLWLVPSGAPEQETFPRLVLATALGAMAAGVLVGVSAVRWLKYVDPSRVLHLVWAFLFLSMAILPVRYWMIIRAR